MLTNDTMKNLLCLIVFLIRCSLVRLKMFSSDSIGPVIMMTIQRRSGQNMHCLIERRKKIASCMRWMCKCWMTVCSAFHCSCGDISMLQIELCVFLWCSWTNQQFNRNNNKRTSKQTNYGYNLRNIVLTDKFSVNAINLTSMQKYSRFLAWYSRYFCFFSSLFGMNITTWHIPCGKKISFDISIN